MLSKFIRSHAPCLGRCGASHRAAAVLTAALLLSMIPSCSQSERSEITQSRELLPLEGQPDIAATSGERFVAPDPSTLKALGLTPAPSAMASRDSAASGGSSPQPQLEWKTPEGWREAGDAPMRILNFAFGPEGDGQGECYLSATGGQLKPDDADGFQVTLDNINRWRGQMGLNPITLEEAKKLPTKKLLNQDGVFVDMSGSYKSVGAAGGKPGYRLVGLLRTNPRQDEPGVAMTLTFKMVGPEALVAENLAAFESFTSSFGVKGMPAPEAAAPADSTPPTK